MPYLIVPLDGSELAERALPLAAYLAGLSGSKLKLVQAPLAPPSLDAGLGIDIVMTAGQEYLQEQEAKLRARYAVGTATRTVVGSAERLILEEAEQHDAAAVVMTTHGRTGLSRALLGSVAEHVLRQSPIPVYLIPAAAGRLEHPRLRHILVPLDGSALAYSVIGPVKDLAKRTGTQVTLLRIFGDEQELSGAPGQPNASISEYQRHRLEDQVHEYFAPIKAHLRAAGILVEAEWSCGVPAPHILAAADRLQVDLIALATHGRSGLERVRYGSVAETTLRQARRPLMTFGPQALKRLARGGDAPAGANSLASPLPAAALASRS